jgi:hypothetical protein
MPSLSVSETSDDAEEARRCWCRASENVLWYVWIWIGMSLDPRESSHIWFLISNGRSGNLGKVICGIDSVSG